MKKITFLGLMTAAVMAFSACNDNNDDLNDQGLNYQESSDGLEITVTYSNSEISTKHTAKFEVKPNARTNRNDTICSSYFVENTFSTSELAKAYYSELADSLSDQEKKDMNIVLSDKTVSFYIPDMVGKNKMYIKYYTKNANNLIGNKNSNTNFSWGGNGSGFFNGGNGNFPGYHFPDSSQYPGGYKPQNPDSLKTPGDTLQNPGDTLQLPGDTLQLPGGFLDSIFHFDPNDFMNL